MEKIKIAMGEKQKAAREWITKNKKEALILGIILLVGAFFRLYKISGYMTFLGDEGRDAIIVRRLLVDFDLILIGPRTSIGDMYLGPLYYYMMAPALFLANYSPAGPSIMVALLGVATIYFVWFVARKWFSRKKHGEISIAGLVAATFYAISPVVIFYSRSSWNPNIMPFFALLSIYSIWKVWWKNNYKWLIVGAVSTAFVLQSHYLGLLLMPTLGFFWLLKFFGIRNTKYQVRDLLKQSLIGLGLFLLLMSPLVIFDARHGWRNFTSMKKFFTERQTTVSARPWTAAPKIWPIFRDNVVTRIVSGGNEMSGEITSYILLIGTLLISAYYLPKARNMFIQTSRKPRLAGMKRSSEEPTDNGNNTILNYFKNKRNRGLLVHGGSFKKNQKSKEAVYLSGLLVVLVWIIVGLIGSGVYKQHIYDHYFGFMYPALFLLVGVVFEYIYSRFGNVGKIFATSGVLLLAISNLLNNPLKYEPNFQMARAIEVAKKIQEKAGEKRFNLAVIAERNYEDGYQYFLEKNSAKVVDIDAQVPSTITQQLFVVCEMPKEKCDPTHNPKAQVANFGWSRVEEEWDVAGITIYKLVHTKGK